MDRATLIGQANGKDLFILRPLRPVRTGDVVRARVAKTGEVVDLKAVAKSEFNENGTLTAPARRA